jgi:Family of unknown function (DUF6524)
MRTISMAGIGMRFVIAFLLVALTWNPTRYNYVAWVMAQFEQPSALWPLVALAGVLLLIGWVVFLRATARSLGSAGIILAVGLAVVVVWILVYYDVVNMQSTRVIAWIVLALLAAILAAGMSWSHLRRAWSGQADVDDVDER